MPGTCKSLNQTPCPLDERTRDANVLALHRWHGLDSSRVYETVSRSKASYLGKRRNESTWTCPCPDHHLARPVPSPEDAPAKRLATSPPLRASQARVAEPLDACETREGPSALAHLHHDPRPRKTRRTAPSPEGPACPRPSPTTAQATWTQHGALPPSLCQVERPPKPSSSPAQPVGRPTSPSSQSRLAPPLSSPFCSTLPRNPAQPEPTAQTHLSSSPSSPSAPPPPLPRTQSP